MTLLGKELRELTPLVAAIVVINLVAIAEYFALASPDEFRWADRSFLLDQSLAELAAVWTIAFAIFAAYLTYPREHDERTIEFLHSLPISRMRVFLTKYLAASGTLIVLLTLLWIPIVWGLQRFDPNSVTAGQLRWGLLLTEATMESAMILIAVAYGMLIAYFRMFGVLGAILLWLALETLSARDASLASLDPASLYLVEYDGEDVIVPWDRWAGHGVAAALALALAARLWNQAGERRSRVLHRLVRSAVYRTATTALAVSTVLLMAMAVLIGAQGPSEDAGHEVDEAEVQVLRTEHLEFRYLLEHEAEVTALAGEADARYAQVRSTLGAPEPATIVVDLTQPGFDHLGLASWKRVRIDFSVLDEPELARHVLDHELAHVVASSLSDGRLADRRLATMVFNEGLAEWVAYELGARPASRAAQRRLARRAWDRLDLEPAELIDAAGFLARFDEYLVYPLGESWVSAMVEACGTDAPGRALRAMARPDAPETLVGAAYWRDTLQASECDLDAVNARFEARLIAAGSGTGDAPVPVATVTVPGNGEAVFRIRLLDAAPNASHTVWLRARDSERATAREVRTRRVRLVGKEPQIVVLALEFASGERFQYQLGVEVEPGERPLYTRWTWTGGAR